MPQPAIELSMLEAVQLFNGKPPGEWTAEELAAFRKRLELSPGLIGMVGGTHPIERRLKEVEAALLEAGRRPAVDVAEKQRSAPQRKPIPVRRLVEAGIFLVLIGTAGFFLVRHLADMRTKPAAAAKVAPPSAGPAAQATTPPAAQPTTQPQLPQPDAPISDWDETTDGELWRGWTVANDEAGQWSLKREWDLTKPGMATTVETLILENGTVRLSRQRKLAPADRWLEIRARPQGTRHPEEKIVVRVNGQNVEQLNIGTGEARWPAFVSLEKFLGQDVNLEVAYEAGSQGTQLFCKSITLAPQKRQIAKRINCGGPAIESPDGDWEADNAKTHPYLVSGGTATFTLKEPAPGTGELQQVYQDERWAYQSVRYRVAVGPGQFDVVLHFAETNRAFQAIGKRLFDIVINEHTVAEKFDIFKTAGGPGALPYRQRIEAVDGEISIRLQPNPTGPAIKGIEIHKVQ